VVRQSCDESIKERLDRYSRSEADFWSFRGKAARNHVHALFQYPAMMVPDMQGVLIEMIRNAVEGIQSAFDPFVGSGTTLTESMLRGMDFTGCDINPLAVLICRVKSDPLKPRTLAVKLTELLARLQEDRKRGWESALPNPRKWFRPEVIVELSRIRRNIRSEPNLAARRFFWVALAEVVRPVSNSRTSTFKLHIRPKDEIESREQSPIELFKGVAQRNFERLVTQRKLLAEKGLLNGSAYNRRVTVQLRDAAAKSSEAVSHDLLVTSPPYGDNQSTVPYGQYSYLPLHWIDGRDVDPAWNDDWIASTHTIDTRSLGGSRLVDPDSILTLAGLSPAFRKTIANLKREPADRIKRVSAFCRDLNRTLPSILSNVRPGGYMIWTVGNRRVGGKAVPLDTILIELLEARGCTHIASASRRIPSKRMAVRNSVTTTMRHESILILKK
jgi:hypothetical protein